MQLVPLPKGKPLSEQPRGVDLRVPELDATDGAPVRVSSQCHVRLTPRQAVMASILMRRFITSEVVARRTGRRIMSTGAAVGELLDRLADELGIDETGTKRRKGG